METQKKLIRTRSGANLHSIDLFRRINTILCPIDLSSDSNKALGYAIALARAFNARLYVCYCVNKLPPGGTGYIRTLIGDSISQHTHPLNAATLNWRSVVVEGSPSEAIIDKTMDLKADLIVMYSRRRPYSAALFGSTAESICRVAPCPVLVVHSDERDWINETTGGIDIRYVLAAHDYSPFSNLALSYALSLSKQYNAELHMLNVLPFGLENVWVPPTEKEKKEAIYRLKKVLPTEAYSKYIVQAEVREGQPYGVILNYVKEVDIDLICIGAHGKKSGEWLFGSNTDRVLRSAPCPILIARS
jgi:nucleotide-binding universal stress UspA family protein